MLIDIAITIFSAIFGFINLFLPTAVSFSIETTNAIIEVGNIVYMVNQFIDVPALFFALTAVVAFEITMIGLQLARWLIRSIPFINSRV